MYFIFLGYFACIKKLFDNKVPEMIEESTPPKAPNPIAETLFNLVIAPLQLAAAANDANFRLVETSQPRGRYTVLKNSMQPGHAKIG